MHPVTDINFLKCQKTKGLGAMMPSEQWKIYWFNPQVCAYKWMAHLIVILEMCSNNLNVKAQNCLK